MQWFPNWIGTWFLVGLIADKDNVLRTYRKQNWAAYVLMSRWTCLRPAKGNVTHQNGPNPVNAGPPKTHLAVCFPSPPSKAFWVLGLWLTYQAPKCRPVLFFKLLQHKTPCIGSRTPGKYTIVLGEDDREVAVMHHDPVSILWASSVGSSTACLRCWLEKDVDLGHVTCKAPPVAPTLILGGQMGQKVTYCKCLSKLNCAQPPCQHCAKNMLQCSLTPLNGVEEIPNVTDFWWGRCYSMGFLFCLLDPVQHGFGVRDAYDK